MSDMQDWNFWEMLERSLPFIGVSVTGAFVRWARFGFRSVGGFLLSAVMAAFSAFLMFAALEDSGLSMGFIVGIVGMAGYSGGTALDAMQTRLLRKIERGGVEDTPQKNPPAEFSAGGFSIYAVPLLVVPVHQILAVRRRRLPFWRPLLGANQFKRFFIPL